MIFIAQIYTQESRTVKSIEPKFKSKQKKRYKRETKKTQKQNKKPTKVQATLTTIGLYYTEY